MFPLAFVYEVRQLVGEQLRRHVRLARENPPVRTQRTPFLIHAASGINRRAVIYPDEIAEFNVQRMHCWC